MKTNCLASASFMNFFAEFSHQYFVFKAGPKIAVKIKDENNLLWPLFS
jgi:hypothetical protein